MANTDQRWCPRKPSQKAGTAGASPTRWLPFARMAVICGAVATAGAIAEETPAVPPLAEKYIQFVEAQGGAKGLRQKAAEATELERIRCQACHGAEGSSPKPEYPNLAGQQPLYLIQQLDRFRGKVRKSLTMHGMAKELDDEMMFHLAAFYASFVPKPNKLPEVPEMQKKRAHGESIFLSRCQHCHGAKAGGQGVYARLAGQKPQYLRAQLERFRSRDRTRVHAGMRAITAGLSDGDIEAIVLYLAGLQ